MPYTIIVENDNSLYGSRKIKIMQREKLFNKLWFLVAPCYNGYDMSQCTVTMRYLLPVSREFKTETLVLSEERYEEYLKYVLPVDTNLTKEWGNIELNLTFTMIDVDDNGSIVQRVRKTENYILNVTQLPDWDSIIPDSALSALDQRIIKQDAQIKVLADLVNVLEDTKADNIMYDKKNNTLQLLSGDKEIGDTVTLKDCEELTKDGVPIVDFNTIMSEDKDVIEKDDNVVEF